VSVEAHGEKTPIWIERLWLNNSPPLRRPGESSSDVILCGSSSWTERA